jgi:glyoxylase-like metal-dependent hydrolase (beta-lactamase superfamily II)
MHAWLGFKNMSQQIPIGSDAVVADPDGTGGIMEVAPDLAYVRTLIANVVFYGLPNRSGWVLIDAGVMGTKAYIQAAAKKRFGSNARPCAIVLTHGHFDHVGVLEDLAQEWDVRVYAHRLEHPYLNGTAQYPPGDPSVGGGLMAGLSYLYPTRPVNVGNRLEAFADDGSLPHMAGWRWLHTPGHCPGHVSFWRESDRILVAGDAFVTTRPESVYATIMQTPELHGPPRYFTIDWDKARSSVARLAALRPDLAVTGHGRAMRGPAMTQALQELADHFVSVAVPKRGRYVERAARAEDGTAFLPV